MAEVASSSPAGVNQSGSAGSEPAISGSGSGPTTMTGARHRPPKLDLRRPDPGLTPNSSLSKSSSEPVPGGVRTHTITAPLPSPSYRTPKEIANDIAIHCVSPGLPPFMKDALLRSKSIEAQQRLIIAQRMASGGGNRRDSSDDESMNADSDRKDTTAVTAAAAATPTVPPTATANTHNISTTTVHIPSATPVSTSSTALRTPNSLRRMNRAPRPVNIKVYPQGTTSMKNRFPVPLSAPIIQHYSSPPYTGVPKSSPPRRVISLDIPPPQQPHVPVPTTNSRTQTTTMYVPAMPKSKVMSAIDPSARMRVLIAKERAERFNAARAAAEASHPRQPRPNTNSDEDEDENDDRDPEDAALSDSELSTGILPSDRPKKRIRVMSADAVTAPGPSKAKNLPSVVEMMAQAGSLFPVSPPSTSVLPKHKDANRVARKARFIELCGEMWDLLCENIDEKH